MPDSPSLSPSERLFGLSFIWQEANYNFAYFDRLPGLDWDAAYRHYIPKVLAAEDLASYYDFLTRFVALLKDGHTSVVPPIALYQGLDRPSLALMNIENCPVVTNALQSVAESVPIGSTLLAVDGIPVQDYLCERVIPIVSETTSHRRMDHAITRLLLGPAGSPVRCCFQAPDGGTIEVDLMRNRRSEPGPWVRRRSLPDPWEFMYFQEWLFEHFTAEPPFVEFEFRLLDGNVAYAALNSFMKHSVADAFAARLPDINRSSGLVLDLRKNHGGSDQVAYDVVSHFIRQPTETLIVRSLQSIASYRSSGVNLKGTPPEKVAELPEWEQKWLQCYRRQLFHEDNWGSVQPSSQPVRVPTVILTDSETASAAEDFLMAFISGQGQATRIGRGSAGSTGMPLIQDLPGGGGFGICTIRMPWPDEVWRTGIAPDMWVEPTIQDVIDDSDRVLKTALEHLHGK